MNLKLWRKHPIASALIAVAALPLLTPSVGAAEAPDRPTPAAAAAPAPAVSSTGKSARLEIFALLGTASSGTGAFAFFDGNRPEFRTMAHPGERIGSCIIQSVGFDHVRLTSGTNEIELPIRKELRRENEGPWRVADLEERRIPREESPAQVASVSGSNLPTSSSPVALSSPADRGERGPSDKDLRKLDKAVVEAMKPGKDLKDMKRDDGSQGIKKIEKSMRRRK